MFLARTFIAIARDPGAAAQGTFAKRLAVSHRDNTKQSDWDIARSYFYALPGVQDCELLAIIEIDNAAEGRVWVGGEEART